MARILVVDDSLTLRRMVVHVLTSAGHDIAEAASAEDALKVLEAFTPDLVLTDMYMPGLDGIDLTVRIRAMPDYGRTPILVLSTDSSDDAKQRGRSSGVTGWIAKPFDPDMLQGVVDKVLH
ncbi:response regulator [Mangrovimicrobium sediminis]|uniref:Response regulator n=1 Tax=Mangrovimicrobium sediminis TaxID=2562682 RepID=A0A4Z0M0W6_9GAMM|nr:response regulator [Haliea sp. SAOS-164]TGD73169.1 response regulator [Haliea sp. SAOS-164]